jgi:hypothetical protein
MIAADTLAMFIVDLFKSRRRVEVENLETGVRLSASPKTDAESAGHIAASAKF